MGQLFCRLKTARRRTILSQRENFVDSGQYTMASSIIGYSSLVERWGCDINNYIPLRRIGMGGFGEVWAYLHISSGRVVAVKAIRKKFVSRHRRRMHAAYLERSIMVQAHTPFHLAALSAFQDSANVYLVSSIHRRGDLMRYMERYSTLSEEEVRFFACDMVMGLYQLHRCCIVYRDLKPDNMLLDELGHIVFADFGLCDYISTADGQVIGCVGTIGFQSPEMMIGMSYGRDVDFFALGVTLYLMSHGQHPWPEHLLQRYRSNLQYEALPNPQFDQQASQELQDLILWLIHPNPRHRPGFEAIGADAVLRRIQSHTFFHGVDWDAVANRYNCHPRLERVDEYDALKDRSMETGCPRNDSTTSNIQQTDRDTSHIRFIDNPFTDWEYDACTAYHIQ